ncbi:oxygen-dependent protoporphyrinogen oxidase [Sanguibacter gelidistatuariae]|uniref:Oxygen-dependent protoporphyrinogen oxidase n=1 Tax=Sanguibacter gelidistatuariae TaxID=1814289 RepID=A0A1G6H863_9MICO|nr:FAD-dependent oxidoreductase [Sanguibacter gelidistatuariae]SDB90469.1 oxygen-dependent protoporphyrinogen oxidase [Sanguibacter gelidistatuariae]
MNQPRGLSDEAASRVDAVVVGGGVAGLVAAHLLVEGGALPVVLEATDQCGGYLAKGRLAAEGAEVWVDVGAESFAARSGVVGSLVEMLGLEIVSPAALSAWGYTPIGRRRARAFPLPAAGVLGIPGHPWAADTRRAIGLLGALRASLDAVLPAERVDASNLAALVRSRLGTRVLARLVTPVAGGVHSTDPALLDVDAVAPGLLAAYRRTGSLTGAIRALRAQAPAGSAVRGIPGGMNQLVTALERSIEASGGEIRRATSALTLRRDGDEWLVRTGPGQVLRTERVVLAASARATQALLTDLVDIGDAEPARGTDIRLVTLLVRSAALGAVPRGTGILVAPGTSVGAKASTHASAKWPWLRSRLDESFGEDVHVVRFSYGRGGAAQPDSATAPADDALVAQAVADLGELYGVMDVQILSSLVTAWDDALAPPTPASRERVARLLADVDALADRGLPGLTVTGAWVAGTGLAAVVPHAQNSARRLNVA